MCQPSGFCVGKRCRRRRRRRFDASPPPPPPVAAARVRWAAAGAASVAPAGVGSVGVRAVANERRDRASALARVRASCAAVVAQCDVGFFGDQCILDKDGNTVGVLLTPVGWSVGRLVGRLVGVTLSGRRTLSRSARRGSGGAHRSTPSATRTAECWRRDYAHELVPSSSPPPPPPPPPLATPPPPSPNLDLEIDQLTAVAARQTVADALRRHRSRGDGGGGGGGGGGRGVPAAT